MVVKLIKKEKEFVLSIYCLSKIKMSTKHTRNRYSQRRFHGNNTNNRQRPDKRPTRQSPEQV